MLNKKIEAELGKAREATKKGNKTLAMTHLKRKKQLEDQLSKLSARRERGGELGDSHLLLVVCEPIPQRARLPTKPCTGRYPDRVETFRALKFQQGVHVWASRMANLLRNTRRMGGEVEGVLWCHPGPRPAWQHRDDADEDGGGDHQPGDHQGPEGRRPGPEGDLREGHGRAACAAARCTGSEFCNSNSMSRNQQGTNSWFPVSWSVFFLFWGISSLPCPVREDLESSPNVPHLWALNHVVETVSLFGKNMICVREGSNFVGKGDARPGSWGIWSLAFWAETIQAVPTGFRDVP